MPSVLASNLAAVLSENPATRVQNESANWPGNPFGTAMNEVRSIMVHVTAGWPPREKAEDFVRLYIGPPPNASARPNAGMGPQYFISGDGTAFKLIDMPSVTWHGNHMNAWSIGVETGNLSHVAPPPGNTWRALSADPNDIPGAKLWISTFPFNEVVVSWWTTSAYNGPARQPPGAQPRMLFTESQYRTWALLARYLCEQHDLPRNFPLLPHALRGSTIDNSSVFRRIALADERFPVLVRALSGSNIEQAHFETANTEPLRQRYAAAIRPQDPPDNRCRNGYARRNDLWTALFGVFRGIHGHGFSGAICLSSAGAADDHDCPGPLFDWHRFAREVWDWWWYPFDLTDDLSAPAVTPRPERHTNGDTPLVEYYFEARDFEAKNQAYLFRSLAPVGAMRQGIFDDISSPSVFRLEPGVPIYAPANGELVAARFPDPRHAVSLAFVLVRHKIFHLPNTLTMEIEGIPLPAHPGRIDYDRDPSYVYSLVMHLGRPEGMSLYEATDANPDWLNRVLMRKKECDLGIALYDAPGHGGVAQAAWDSRPPGSVSRPTVLEGWRADQGVLQSFLDDLRAGEVALAAWSGWNPSVSPIRVILGDFLGESGPNSQGGRERLPARHRIGGVLVRVRPTDLPPLLEHLRVAGAGRIGGAGLPVLPERVGQDTDGGGAATPCGDRRESRPGALVAAGCDGDESRSDPAAGGAAQPGRLGVAHAAARLHALDQRGHLDQRVAEIPGDRRKRRRGPAAPAAAPAARVAPGWFARPGRFSNETHAGMSSAS